MMKFKAFKNFKVSEDSMADKFTYYGYILSMVLWAGIMIFAVHALGIAIREAYDNCVQADFQWGALYDLASWLLVAGVFIVMAVVCFVCDFQILETLATPLSGKFSRKHS